MAAIDNLAGIKRPGGWISLGKSSGCNYDRKCNWNKMARLRPDPAGCVDNTVSY